MFFLWISCNKSEQNIESAKGNTLMLLEDQIRFSEIEKRDSLFYEKDSSIPYSGTYVVNNNGVTETMTLNNGMLHGPYSRSFKNNQVEVSGRYVNNYEDGLFTTFYESGQVYSKANFSNKKMNGNFKLYYENGLLKFLGNYIEGQLEGVVKTFFENGKVATLENFVNGQRHGVFIRYNENGESEFQGNYKNGQLESEN